MSNKLLLKALCFYILFTLLLSPVFSEITGDVEGTLTVNKKNYDLKYVYAEYKNGFFDKGRDDVLIILSDIPLKKKYLNDIFKRKKLEEKGMLHCLEFTLNWKHMIMNIIVRDKAFQFTPNSSNTDFVFEPQKTTKNKIKGRVYSKQEQDFLGVKYNFDCIFESGIKAKKKD